VLLTKSFKDRQWLKDMRLWTLFAWLFMGIGNVLGALWAYVELGWGGFWAWDPVENASLLPWLTGTALLHSITIYEKRNTLKVWTYVLSFITFFLCILGTYITRSGAIASVHAFEKSPIAFYFLTAMILIFVIPLALLVLRYRDVEPVDIKNYATREGTYAISNWLFLAFTFIVLYGTLFPLFSSIVTGNQASGDEGLSVARSFFDTYTSPVMFGIAILIAICPHFLFSGVNLRKLSQRLLIGLSTGALVVGLTWNFWATNLVGAAAGVIGIAGFIMTISIFIEDYLNGRGRFLARFLANGRKYGGYIAHLGAILMFMGVFAATVYKVETNVTLNPGETAEFKDIKILYEQPVYDKGPNYETFGAQVTLIDSGRKTGRLYPSFSYYPASNQQTYEVDIDWGILRDVYLALKEMKFEEPYTATITVSLEPLTMFIWIGSLLIFLGTTYALWPRKRPSEEEESL
jgi:cytochrome c-type biogenesis protein CcmF